MLLTKESYIKLLFVFLFIYPTEVLTQTDVESEEPTEPPKPACQEEFYDPSGMVESPNYPDSYPNDQNCAYRILTNRRVTVTFDRFSLENSENCRYDFLQFIFEATSNKNDPQKYCGEGLDKINDGVLSGYGPLIIGFISDESDSMKGFKFTYEIDLSDEVVCDSDPCLNNGTCETYPGYYKCICHDAYAGINCEINKDECASYPCKHGAECVDEDNGFTCQCINGFEGELCEINPDRCEDEPCENGGICHSRNIDFVCSCPNDFLGDRCETPVPAFAPETTTQPFIITTTPPPSEDNEKEDSGDEENGGSKNDDKENDVVDAITQSPIITTQPSPPDDDSNGRLPVIVSIILVALVIAIILSLFLCYWLKNRRDEKNEQKEMTNLARKSHNTGEGKLRRCHSKTTSFESSAAGNHRNGHRLRPMSGEVIMEEHHEEPYRDGTSYTYNSTGKIPLNHMNNMNNISNIGSMNNAILPPTYNMHSPQAEPFKRMNVPLSGNEQIGFQDKSSYISPTPLQGKLSSQYSPDAALQLLNQIKDNRNQFGINEINRNPYQGNEHHSNHDNPSQYDQFNPNLYSTPHREEMSLPHIPMAGHLNETYLPDVNEYDAGIELSAEEAADVVNNLLSLRPSNGDTVTSQEALDIISKVRNKNSDHPRPSYDREKSVVFKPQEVANILNSFRNRRCYENTESDEKNGYELPSTYENSDNEGKGLGRAPQDFRECTRITEESNETSDSIDKKAGSDSKKHLLAERTVRKRPKRFPYANTLDPADKVNNWLKNSSRASRPEKNSSASRECSVVTESHIITRRLQPTKNNKNDKPIHEENPSDTDGPYKTITQPPKMLGQEKRLPLTENKAKNLVEKLVRAPMRSNQNIVGPGLGVNRQNAFVGDGVRVESY